MTYFTDDLSLPYIIAELGPNWCVSTDRNANEERLSRLIDVACVAGANAIKLQLKSFKPGGYYARESAEKRAAAITDPLSPFSTREAYIRAREPDVQMLSGVIRYCQTRNLDWSASPWDLPSVETLRVLSPYLAWVKVASASITDLPLLEAVASLGKHVVMSTGMSTQDEIDLAMSHFARGQVTLLHCVSAYPAVVGEIDLRVMDALHERYGCQVGWSGHERGIGTSIAATARGAVVIERHLTMDKDEWGPDHRSSLDPAEFIQMVKGCRDARRTMRHPGMGLKQITPSEEVARERLRRV